MFRDQKNINIKVLSWLLLAMFVANMHYTCTFIYLDVLHLNKTISINVAQLQLKLFWRDVFPFYNAPEKNQLDIQWYLMFVGDKMRDCILSYLLYSAVSALVVVWNTIHRYSKLYRRIKLLTKGYLFIQIYGLLNYILFMGQFMQGLPVFAYTVIVLLIFFIHRENGKWQFKAEL